MTITPADFQPLGVDLVVAAGILIVLVVDLLLPARAGAAIGWLTAVLLGLALAASFHLDTSGSAFAGAYVGGDWALFFKRTFLTAGLLAVLGSIRHLARHQTYRQGEYYLLILFSVLGMTLLPGARDVILLIIAFELMGLPLFVLAAYAKRDDPNGPERFAPEAGLKLYLVGVASAAITLYGLSLVYGATGATAIDVIARAPSSPLLTLGALLVLAGMGFKIGAVPFHFWVPDTYQGSSTPFVAFLSVAPKIAGFAALTTLFYLGFPGLATEWQPLVLAISVVSMVLGNVLAVVQSNVKRLLAFSGVAHIGYMLLGFVTTTVQGATMLLFYAAAYVVTNIGAFQVVEEIEEQTGDSSLAAFDGLHRRAPGLAFAMLLFLLSLAGIPFVVGFWAKLYVFVAAWHAGYHFPVALGAVLAVVGLFYYLQIARAMYMKPAQDNARVASGPALTLAIGLCLAGVVVLGAFPAPLLESAERAARPFFAPTSTGIP
jgi:NADH-quinone oxidoreductase subunit N